MWREGMTTIKDMEGEKNPVDPELYRPVPLDPKGLEAALKGCLLQYEREMVIAAIRAWEAHKASAVPDEVREVAEWLRAGRSSMENLAAALLEQQAREIERLRRAAPPSN